MRAAIMVWLMMAGAALAAPAETPPDDFRGAQYIDSAGCVFLREGTAWTARLDSQGALICGYPPSLTSRSAHASEAEPDEPRSPEEALSETLAYGLRDGELTADTRPREERRPAPPVKTPASSPLADLPGLVVAAPVLQREMGADLNPNRRLCDLLGYPTDGTTSPGLGADATQGFCGGDAEAQPLRRIVTAPSAETAAPEKASTPDQQTAAAKPSSGAAEPQRSTHRDKLPLTAKPLVRSAKPGAAQSAASRAGPRPEMIPAGARFVHLGRFDDEQSRRAVIDRLRDLGYPVARERAQDSSLYAGPFRDRRSLVAALNDLRTRGIGRPVAR